MNAKKKNKKSNKPPNPNPPQNVESVPKKEEKIEDVQVKCEVKEQILIPEVPSEVMVTPVCEIKEAEVETPKKPKRNKGKNKKHEKEEEKIEVSEKTDEIKVESIPLVEKSQKLNENIQEQAENLLVEANVVPSARKKKNKKKTQDKTLEESKTPVEEITLPKSEKIEPLEKIDPEIQELFSPKPELLKEGKKKKNKKKNRNDSEKSDKSDNMISCTAAFEKILASDVFTKQEILETESDKQDQRIDAKIESQGVKTETANDGSFLTTETAEFKMEADQIKDTSKDENKNKKKNKKDKKQQQKENVEISKPSVPLENFPILKNAIPENISALDLKEEAKETLPLSSDLRIKEEPSLKLKTKIAKPVDKKQKNKPDVSLQNVQKIESSEFEKEDEKVNEPPKEPELNINITESHEEDTTKHQSPIIPVPMETISVPPENKMGKKRKKSPKPHKHKEDFNITTNVVEEIKPETVSDFQEPPKIESVVQCETQITTSNPVEMVSQLLPTETKLSEKEQRLNSSEAELLERPFSLTPEIKKDSEGFEIKTSKKKKKSPKAPQAEVKPTTSENIAMPLFENENSGEREKSKTESSEKIFYVSMESQLSADIEVRSARTESEASSCDVIPDVQFLRSSSSQNLPDSNNNTVIQELLNVDEIKLSDLQLNPIIQGSGETSVPTPELVSSDIRMTEIEAKKHSEEKTDIKSKMMEVNQDMEELRLSIERSLAEFTALEKCEQESEKKTPKKELKKEKSPTKGRSKEKEPEGEIESQTRTKENKTQIVEIPEVIEKSTAILKEEELTIEAPPVCPARKDNKSKGKPKKKGKQESTPLIATTSTSSNEPTTTKSSTKDDVKDEKKEKSEDKSKKSESSQEKGKQQSTNANDGDDAETSIRSYNEEHSVLSDVIPVISEVIPDLNDQTDFEPIENFEDALTSSVDDVNKTFEMIAKNVDDDNIEFQKKLAANKPEINITEPVDDKDTNKNEKINPVSQPKNLLGQTDIPVQSNRTDYKKEKNKTPNARQAKVKIKDASEIETKKQSKESQTDNKRSRKIPDKSVKESFSRVKNENEEYVYKYSFRKVFLQSACHVCNKDLCQVRVPCGYCNLIFYCGAKHKDEDWPQHQALCFAVSTLAHMKDQKHIYADAQNTSGQDYRLLRMQMIVSCEKVLKRRLVPWEQELMLYPRMCAELACREWRQAKLKDCDGCGQLSYCAANPGHLPKSHARWCKSYSLYQRLVNYQQTKGRLEPRLPTKVMVDDHMAGKMNEVLAAMYEEKIDMNDIQYASLTQLATAPLTTAYCLQLGRTASGITNGIHRKHPFTIHVVGAELQFEADALNKWETFFLHLRPDVDELRVVLVSPALNPGNLPLDLLGKIKLCDNCQQNKRRVIFKFEDNKNYSEYRSSEDFINPDIICAFNPSIQRSSIYNGKDPWPASINAILKLKSPFVITSYTLNELRKDVARVKQISEIEFKFISEPGFNNFASVRPDRNFISDDEMPLLFKNYCVAVIVGC